MAKILILIGGHLCTAPRPQKEADTLSDAGHEVTVRGFWFDPELIERDRRLIAHKKWRFAPVVAFQSTGRKSRINNLRLRFHRRIAQECYRRFGLFSPESLGYGVRAMLKAARHERADLTIVHSEGGLWVGDRLLDAGYNVGVDFEDWFSEDLLPEARISRPISELKAFEGRLARECSYRLTTSHALADQLSKAYTAPKPEVVYNVFPFAERQAIDGQKRDRRNPTLPSLHWFSQTVGPGRGLEDLLKSLPHLNISAEIHLRGNCPEATRQWLDSLIFPAWRDRLFIHPTVPNVELLSRIAEHDIGLALECKEIPSRNLTVTNKLFQYLQGGLAVIATDTAGQREVLEQAPVAGRMIPIGDPQALARAIEDLLCTPGSLERAKAAALDAAEEKFCWEKQAETLLQTAELALAGRYKRKSVLIGASSQNLTFLLLQ